VVVVEEEDTTRELRRLEFALSRVVKQIKVNTTSVMLVFDVVDRRCFIVLVHLQGIAQTAEQWRQLIKRMEPLAKENTKLKEAMKLMEKNIRRAQHERDLAESQAWDLEYKKGVVFEQLAIMSKQLWGRSKQLTIISKQLTSVSKQLE